MSKGKTAKPRVSGAFSEVAGVLYAPADASGSGALLLAETRDPGSFTTPASELGFVLA